MGAPGIEPRRELRFGVVMYGGVSLAVYINGVTQELYHLVRSTAPARDGSGRELPVARAGDAELVSTQAVYRRAARRVGGGDAGDADAPLRVRFVVDLLAGSSAGGINAVFLGKALAGDRPVDGLTQLWLDEADIGALVNDTASVDPASLVDVLRESPPSALLNGARMTHRLVAALDAMDAEAPPPSPLVEQLDVFITATDLVGRAVDLKLDDRVVQEPAHRAVWRFSSDALPPSPHNQLLEADNELLTFAARSTSSFPGAFAPASLADVERIAVAARPNRDRPADESVARLFADYDEPRSASRQRWFGDGGSLDNSPFAPILDALADRRSVAPVDRRLVYIEPSPGEASLPPPGGPPPTAVGNVLQQAVLLPRTQTIREDLDRVRARNAAATRVLELLAEVDRIPASAWPAPPVDADAWLSQPPGPLAEAPVLRLKLRLVIDELGRVLADAAGLEPSSDRRAALVSVLTAWVEQDDDWSRRKRFLLDFDFDYRLRRINLVQRVADAALASEPGDGGELLEAKRQLNVVYRMLEEVRGGLLAGDDEAVALLRTVVSGVSLDELLAGQRTGEGDASEGARRLVAGPVAGGAIDAVLGRLAVTTAATFRYASDLVRGALASPPLRPLREAYERFEVYDNVTLPLVSTFDGELDPVEVARISPRDATAIVDEADGRRKLAGSAIANFGAFFETSWRANDLLWGRLDGAERLLTMVVDDSGARDSLIREAHLRIVEDERPHHPEWGDRTGTEVLDLLAAAARDPLDWAVTLDTAARASLVAGPVLARSVRFGPAALLVRGLAAVAGGLARVAAASVRLRRRWGRDG